MITGIRGLGEHLLAKGAATPFLWCSSAYMYPSLHKAETAIKEIGEGLLQNERTHTREKALYFLIS